MQVGDDVVTMSAPGRFTVIAIDGAAVTIQNNEGVRKTVLTIHLRPLPRSTEPS